MSNSNPKKYIYDTAVPNIEFNIRGFSSKVTLIGYVFAQGLAQIDELLHFIRVQYHVFEPYRESIIKGYLDQINEGKIKDLDYDYDWNKHFQTTFSWDEQEKLISELVFTKLVKRYITYLKDMASYVIDKNQFPLDKKVPLRNFPNIKKCFHDHFNTPLYLEPEDETLAGQLISMVVESK